MAEELSKLKHRLKVMSESIVAIEKILQGLDRHNNLFMGHPASGFVANNSLLETLADLRKQQAEVCVKLDELTATEPLIAGMEEASLFQLSSE